METCKVLYFYYVEKYSVGKSPKTQFIWTCGRRLVPCPPVIKTVPNIVHSLRDLLLTGQFFLFHELEQELAPVPINLDCYKPSWIVFIHHRSVFWSVEPYQEQAWCQQPGHTVWWWVAVWTSRPDTRCVAGWTSCSCSQNHYGMPDMEKKSITYSIFSETYFTRWKCF